MNVTFAPRGILQIDDARIIYRNFEGRGDKYNREGDRNFAVIIPDRDICDQLLDAGWNVRIKPSCHEDEPDQDFMYLPVKVKFNDKGPNAYLISANRRSALNENTIGCLDDVEINCVNLDIRPYDWVVNGKEGRTAYLQAIEVTQNIDRFAARYAEEEAPEEEPF